MTLHRFVLLLLLLLPAQIDAQNVPGDARRKRVLAEIATASARAQGDLSVAALNLETDERVSWNGDRTVFMSSVVKLPIAVQLLARVDRGELSLEKRIRLEPSDLRVGGARGLATRYPNGVTLTVQALVRYAISESDNTASDALLRYSGGPRRVTQELRALNIAGVSIDHSYAENTWRYNGVDNPPPAEQWTPALFDRTVAASSPAAKEGGAASFMRDPSDRATPAAMVNMLARLERGQILSAKSAALLRRFMTESVNPTARIVAGAPAGARVAHKTGSWGSRQGQMVAVNDVGIVYRAKEAPVVIAVMISGGRAPLREQERAIADVTRILMRYWAAGGKRTSLQPTTSFDSALDHVNIVDVEAGVARKDMTVFLEAGRIKAIRPSSAARLPANSRVIDGRGGWVVPGFVDMHFHVVTAAMLYRRTLGQLDSTYHRTLAERLLRVALASGVTTIRDPGASPASEGLSLRSDLRAGKIVGPDLFTAGAIINRSRLSDHELRITVSHQAAEGVDFVKVYGGIGPAQVAVVVDEAHRLGKKVIGHLQRTSWTEAARAGIDFITHGAGWHESYLPAAKQAEYLAITDMSQRIAWYEAIDTLSPALDTMARELAARQVSIDPTLIAYHTKFFFADSIYQRDPNRGIVPELLQNWEVLGMPSARWTADQFLRVRNAWPKQLALIRQLHAAGVLITTGSDVASPWVIPGIAYHQELELLASAGFSPAEVLRMATLNGAIALGQRDEIGTVDVGKRADLVVLDANPLEHVGANRKIRLVLRNGHALRPEILINRLQHSPKIPVYVERERPSPSAQPSRDIEAQDIEQRERPNSQ